MTHTARTYNITVKHRRRILATTQGHPARWNDKTLSMFDNFMQRLRHGDILDDVIFELYDRDESGTIIKQRYEGAWLLVDNGYLSHSTTVPQIKNTSKRGEIRFSAWLESLRKDVECTFGILKGRWRILKTGVRLFGVKAADEIFLTFCALHNWLLEVNGLDERWQDGVPSNWEVSNEYTNGDMTTISDIPGALLRLQYPVQHRNYNDTSRMCPGDDVPQSIQEDVRENEGEEEYSETVIGVNDGNGDLSSARKVRSMEFVEFCQKLVTHFNIAFQRNELQWPR